MITVEMANGTYLRIADLGVEQVQIPSRSGQPVVGVVHAEPDGRIELPFQAKTIQQFACGLHTSRAALPMCGILNIGCRPSEKLPDT